MIEIAFNEIFRIGEDGIYYNNGKLDYKEIDVENGFHGEERFEEGKFKVVFYTKENFTVLFPITPICQNGLNLSEARAKCGSFILHLSLHGLKIKSVEYK